MLNRHFHCPRCGRTLYIRTITDRLGCQSLKIDCYYCMDHIEMDIDKTIAKDKDLYLSYGLRKYYSSIIETFYPLNERNKREQ